MKKIPSNLTCPICGSFLAPEGGSVKCKNRHNYDISSYGYINLLNPGKKNNFKSGDSKEMIAARSEFLSSGAYRKASDTLAYIAGTLGKGTEKTILGDAGCGDGYHTLNILRSYENIEAVGFDASKYAAEHAARAAEKTGLSDRAFFSAANIFSIPAAPETFGIVVNVFAPEACGEFLRVLAPGGFLITGSAGARHLYEMKEILYGKNVRLNDPRGAKQIPGFSLEEEISSTYKTEVTSNRMLRNLLTMTPYFYKTAYGDKTKLDAVDFLRITVDFDFFVYRKKQKEIL